MKVYNNFEDMEADLPGHRTAITIGVFDGLHLGHQLLIRRTCEVARHASALSLVITFPDHPLTVLAPPYAPKKLVSNARKHQLIAALGVDLLVDVEFTEAFAAQAPEQFIEDLLLSRCKMAALVCGYDFSFGRGGAGNRALLEELSNRHGFELHFLEPVSEHDVTVKSTMIRDLLLNGYVEKAAQLLSRPYELEGPVVTGRGRGRQIGFPTANIAVPTNYVIPSRSVYLCAAAIDNAPAIHGAMINIGHNPTFGEQSLSIEAHLLNFSDDLRGKTLHLFFLRRLRDERKFPSVDALVTQLQNDRIDSLQLFETTDIKRQLTSIEALLQR